MSIIAVSGIPFKFSIKQMVNMLAKTVNGHFEGLNFGDQKAALKTLYLRLSEMLDPLGVVERINGRTFGPNKFKAFVPNKVPDLPLAKKRVRPPMKIRKKLKLPPTYDKGQATHIVQKEIMLEMQSKYTGLMDLNKTLADGQLLNELSKVVLERARNIMQYMNTPDCSQLTREYRKKFPHDGDFALVESVLRRLGALAEPLTNAALKPMPGDVDPMGSVPYKKAREVCSKYADRIIKQINTHIENLSTAPEEGQDPAKEAARIKVRQQLKKLNPYVAEIVRLVVSRNVLPEKSAFTVLRVYGEPRLPGKEHMIPVLSRMGGRGQRSQRIFNLLTVKLPRDRAPALLALDDTRINNCKLIVRPLHLEQQNEAAALIDDEVEAEAEDEAEADADMLDEADDDEMDAS